MSVVSARKLAANRANARASTGPKSAAGKARSARNAVRHGLSGATWADPAISRAIEQVGRTLAGGATGQERELAYAVAAAEVDLARARDSGRKLCAEPRIAAALARSLCAPGTPAAVAPEEDPEQPEELLCDAVYKLEAIKRYEGRAFARRQRAIGALDDKRIGAVPPSRRLPRPRGLRLPRWRPPQPFGRVIRFEGLPRWAWWRPDPLDAEPKRRRAPRRKAPADVPGELELLVSPAPLARPRVFAKASTEIPEASVAALPNAVTQHSSETNPPQAGAAGSEPTPAAPDPPAPVPPPETTPTQQPRETKLPRGWAKPTPLPTCRAGPCRWVGEMPADHWSYRSWRYRRTPAQALRFGPTPQIDPMARRCRGSPRGRSRAPP